jgi:hypothetical protein
VHPLVDVEAAVEEKVDGFRDEGREQDPQEHEGQTRGK